MYTLFKGGLQVPGAHHLCSLWKCNHSKYILWILMCIDVKIVEHQYINREHLSCVWARVLNRNLNCLRFTIYDLYRLIARPDREFGETWFFSSSVLISESGGRLTADTEKGQTSLDLDSSKYHPRSKVQKCEAFNEQNHWGSSSSFNYLLGAHILYHV